MPVATYTSHAERAVELADYADRIANADTHAYGDSLERQATVQSMLMRAQVHATLALAAAVDSSARDLAHAIDAINL